MTDEQKQKMIDDFAEQLASAAGVTDEVKIAALKVGYRSALNARDEEVKVLREALNEASELVEALMMDNRGKVYEQAQDFMQAKLQQFIDAHQALEHTSKKEVKT